MPMLTMQHFIRIIALRRLPQIIPIAHIDLSHVKDTELKASPLVQRAECRVRGMRNHAARIHPRTEHAHKDAMERCRMSRPKAGIENNPGKYTARLIASTWPSAVTSRGVRAFACKASALCRLCIRRLARCLSACSAQVLCQQTCLPKCNRSLRSWGAVNHTRPPRM